MVHWHGRRYERRKIASGDPLNTSQQDQVPTKSRWLLVPLVNTQRDLVSGLAAV